MSNDDHIRAFHSLLTKHWDPYKLQPLEGYYYMGRKPKRVLKKATPVELGESQQPRRFIEFHDGGVSVHGASDADVLRGLLRMVFGGILSDEAYRKTPERFLRYLNEFQRPFDPHVVLGDLFEGPEAEGINGLVVQSNIPFRMMCEHHLLPATGEAFVGYIPYKKVVGLSKMARLVDAIAVSRPNMQERICEQIVNTLDSYTEARGTICVIDSMHTCMACRGVNTPEVTSTTSCVRGVFRDVPAARQEFFSIIGRLRSQ